MSLKRRILKQAGVSRKTKRLVISVTATAYPEKDGVKPKTDVHLNVDLGGLNDAEAAVCLRKAAQEVQDRLDVARRAATMRGQAMLEEAMGAPPTMMDVVREFKDKQIANVDQTPVGVSNEPRVGLQG